MRKQGSRHSRCSMVGQSAGHSRFVVNHVVNMRLAEIRDTVRETLVTKRQKIKQWYEQNATKREFRPGDEVLLLLPSDSSKVVAQWKGPYRVIRKVNDVIYEVSVGVPHTLAHNQHL